MHSLVWWLAALLQVSIPAPPPLVTPPPVAREFRAAWVATVANIDWPSTPGLSTWEQQQELLAILNRAVTLRLNAVIFHVRPGADALYASTHEPWSQYITGRQGRGPEPAWDPLTFAVAEAHRRGLELHAWFNPYRALNARTADEAARSHITRTDPSLVWAYDRYLWMDPGHPEVRRRAIRVIADVATRYDVDGIHLDDYFYPYPITDAQGQKIDFPDAAMYAQYRKSGGALVKEDWRRRNVDLMVEGVFTAVRAVKPRIKIGISPFGIWRPGHPAQIKGFDAYAEIYADSRKWLQRGWVDYLTPQLYWPIDRAEQSYPVLLRWWLEQNTAHRHIWPGLATYRIADPAAAIHVPAEEIIEEIRVTRATPGATGHVHFSMTTLMKSPEDLGAKLLASTYDRPALVPATPWLGATRPPAPTVRVTLGDARDRVAAVGLTGGGQPWLWTVRSHANGAWTTEIIPGTERRHRLPVAAAGEVIVTAVNRSGIESHATRVTFP